ncbi:MAG TPA: 6-pyruvoyl-tetrahydropterin synthase-related protein, partial [Aggregatilineales bacterium]|nr:6-pyruvoyl-tetrahydropterin synthase-related protein [Aggregatilineales bacterium]
MNVPPPKSKPLSLEDLPQWMHPQQRRMDYAFIAVFALCCVIALPWLTRDGLPASPAAEAQIARIAEVAENFQVGVIYPRWASHFHYGYGSPLFNYIAPLPHYLGGLHLLLGQSSPDVSFAALMFTSVFIAGIGMFAHVRRRWGNLAGLLATVLYLVSPPLLLNVPYIEADLSLMMAAAFFPCVLWAGDRVLSSGDGRDIALLALFTALLLTSATVMGVLLLIVALLWLAWIVWLEPEHSRRALLMGIVIGTGLTAFYWLPALAERNAVHWVPVEEKLRPLSLQEVLRPPLAFDPEQFNRIATGELGPAAMGFALLGSVILLLELRRGEGRPAGTLPAVAFMVPVTLLLIVAIWIPGRWLDSASTFPVIRRLDLLIPISACFAILGAQCARAVETYVQRALLRGVGVMLLAAVSTVSSFQIMQPPAFVPYRVDDPLDAYMQSELRGTFSGTFQNGQLLPAELAQLPAPSLALLDSYRINQVLKVEYASRLPRSNLAILSHSPVQDTFRVESNRELIIEVLTLNFAGWKASFQGQPVPLRTTPENGFIEVTAPPG